MLAAWNAGEASALDALVERVYPFLALCAQVMRRIMVDYARHRAFAKRGGQAVCVTLDEAAAALEPRDVDLLALDEALQRLATTDRRKSHVVERRYFAGLGSDPNSAAERSVVAVT